MPHDVITMFQNIRLVVNAVTVMVNRAYILGNAEILGGILLHGINLLCTPRNNSAKSLIEC